MEFQFEQQKISKRQICARFSSFPPEIQVEPNVLSVKMCTREKKVSSPLELPPPALSSPLRFNLIALRGDEHNFSLSLISNWCVSEAERRERATKLLESRLCSAQRERKIVSNMKSKRAFSLCSYL